VATVISPARPSATGPLWVQDALSATIAHIGPTARVGAACIVNTGVVSEHDCVVGDCCLVSVHACLAGKADWDCVFLGAGSVVINGVQVASHVTIGAGGVPVRRPIRLPGLHR
jgi:UDP-N-acetylbacillosamine N-acetyltransferase